MASSLCREAGICSSEHKCRWFCRRQISADFRKLGTRAELGANPQEQHVAGHGGTQTNGSQITWKTIACACLALVSLTRASAGFGIAGSRSEGPAMPELPAYPQLFFHPLPIDARIRAQDLAAASPSANAR